MSRYGRRVDAGTLIYPQGEICESLYVVVRGRIVFEVVDASGARAAVHEARPGDCFGHVSAFSARPTSAAATAAETTVLLAIPESQAETAFRNAPKLAVLMMRQFALSSGTRRRASGLDDPLQPEDDVSQKSTRTGAGDSAAPLDHSLAGVEYDSTWFFTDETVCPVCDQSLE
jgi:CRP-like cAMP-binding protein